MSAIPNDDELRWRLGMPRKSAPVVDPNSIQMWRDIVAGLRPTSDVLGAGVSPTVRRAAQEAAFNPQYPVAERRSVVSDRFPPTAVLLPEAGAIPSLPGAHTGAASGRSTGSAGVTPGGRPYGAMLPVPPYVDDAGNVQTMAERGEPGYDEARRAKIAGAAGGRSTAQPSQADRSLRQAPDGGGGYGQTATYLPRAGGGYAVAPVTPPNEIQPGLPGEPDPFFDSLDPQEQRDLVDVAGTDPDYGPEIAEARREIIAAEGQRRSLDSGGKLTSIDNQHLAEHINAQKRRINRIASQFGQHGVGAREAVDSLRMKRMQGRTWVDPNTGATLGLSRNGEVRQVSPPTYNMTKIAEAALASVTARHKANAFDSEGKAINPKVPTAEEIAAEVRLIVAGIRAAQIALNVRGTMEEPEAEPTEGAPQVDAEGYANWLKANYPELVGQPQDKVHQRALDQQFGAGIGVPDDTAEAIRAAHPDASDEEIEAFLQETGGQ